MLFFHYHCCFLTLKRTFVLATIRKLENILDRAGGEVPGGGSGGGGGVALGRQSDRRRCDRMRNHSQNFAFEGTRSEEFFLLSAKSIKCLKLKITSWTKHFIENRQNKLKTTVREQVNGDLISTQNTHEEIKWVDSDLVSKHKTDHVYATH